MKKLKILFKSLGYIKVTSCIFFMFIFLVASCPVKGQVIMNKDYFDQEWSQLINLEPSPLGNWSIYKLQYHKTDTLIVHHVKSDKTFKIPNGVSFDFTNNEDWFLAIDTKSILHKIDLKNKQHHTIGNVANYELSNNHNFIGILYKNDQLEIINLLKNTRAIIEDVTEYQFTKEENAVYIIKDTPKYKSVELFSLNENKPHKIISQNPTQPYKKLTTNTEQNRWAFFQEASFNNDKKTAYKLIIYNPLNQNTQLLELDLNNHLHLKDLSFDSLLNLVLAQEAKTVFFKLRIKPSKTNLQILAEEWDTKDKWIYPRKKINENKQKMGPWWYAWNLKINNIVPLENSTLSNAIISTNAKHVLLLGNENNQSQLDYDYKVKVYLKELATGETKQIIRLNQKNTSHLKIAPDGNYIQYFKDKHWWIYNIQKDTHTNITKKLNRPFHQLEYDMPGSPPPYGSPGWLVDGKEVLLYDKLDIWAISMEEFNAENLTNGYKENTSFRFYEAPYAKKLSDYLKHKETPVFNLKNDYVLKATSHNKETGFFKLSERTNIQKIVFENAAIDQISRARTNDLYTYRKQSFDKAPVIKWHAQNSQKTIYQSNPFQLDMDWGKSELIHYKDRYGDSLQAALIYPSNYNPGKKYPMVVHIYQKKSRELHNFIAPSYYNYDGFNASNLALNGFFVLLPDIKYTIGEVGKSAIDCVTSAVNKVKEMNLIDPKRIGLIGMSFGGYQTAYIITQTNMFAAAVIGVAPTNLITKYHSVTFGFSIEAFKLVENLQYRMGVSYYENPEIYKDNSPLHFVQNINTPVLQWAGKEDDNVDWKHNLELHLALRRLNKNGKLLLYPNEKHHLENPEKQKHLTLKIQQWFNDYLKQ